MNQHLPFQSIYKKILNISKFIFSEKQAQEKHQGFFYYF